MSITSIEGVLTYKYGDPDGLKMKFRGLGLKELKEAGTSYIFGDPDGWKMKFRGLKEAGTSVDFEVFYDESKKECYLQHTSGKLLFKISEGSNGPEKLKNFLAKLQKNYNNKLKKFKTFRADAPKINIHSKHN